MQQAINRSFDILEFVAIDPETPCSFNSIAQSTGLNTGTCANIIKAMVKRGYLEKLDDKKGYLLGKKIYQLTSFDGYKKDIIKVAKPVLEDLTAKIKENTLLAVLKESSRIVLLQVLGEQSVQAVSPGDKHAYDSSTGRMLIAMMNDEEIIKFVDRFGLPVASQWKEATTLKKFLSETNKIRENGYTFQESEKNITGIAAPIFQNGNAIASVCIFLPTFRLEGSNKNIFIAEIKKAAKKITSSLAL